MNNPTCEHYQPGEEMGKTRPVCKYWHKKNNGVCTHQHHLMCELWIKTVPVIDEKGRRLL